MFKILDKECTPTKGTEFSACVDLYAREDVVIGAGETVLVPLGVKIDLEKHLKTEIINEAKYMRRDDVTYENYLKNKDFTNREIMENPLNNMQWVVWVKDRHEKFMKSHQLNLHIRSSISAKHGLIIANGTGIIDMDYEDEIMICLHNPVAENIITWWIDRLAQMVGIQTNFNIDNTANFLVKKGQRIAQISLVEHKSYLFGIETTDKRAGGFGSTDKKPEQKTVHGDNIEKVANMLNKNIYDDSVK